MTQAQLRTVAHGCTLAYSFSRCLCLPSRRRASPPGSSCQRFGNDTELPWSSTPPQISPPHGYPNITATCSSGGTCLRAYFEADRTACADDELGFEDTRHEISPVSSWYSCAVARTGACSLNKAISIFSLSDAVSCFLQLSFLVMYPRRTIRYVHVSTYIPDYLYGLHVSRIL